LWLLLGEAQSKIEHSAGIPLPPPVHEHLNQLYLAKGALATTAIEGNTLTEDEALRRIQGKLELPPSREYLGREIDNIVKAVNAIWADQDGRYARLTPELLCSFNLQVLDGLPLGSDVVPGQIRRHSVGVGRYLAPPWEDCGYLVARLCEWLHGSEFAPPLGREITTAILKAVIAHLYVAWVHPFGDGNGRTARLTEFQILVQAGVPMPAAHLLSNHYNATRTEYYKQLDEASGRRDPLPFVLYAVRGLIDGLREQIALIRGEQWRAAWRDYVTDTFRDRRSKADLRRQRLLLDLSAASEPVPRGKLTDLSPRVARDYAGRTGKTVTRDINELRRLNLVTSSPKGYAANLDLLLAFQPHRKAGV